MDGCLEKTRVLPERRRVLAGLVAGAAAAAFVGLVAAPARAASTGNFGFYSHTTQTWTVPPGVNTAIFDLYGAVGGGNDTLGHAAGGHVHAVLPVVPGDQYVLVVGGTGGDPHGPSGIDGGAGGYNGGGAGGDGNGLGYAGWGAGGGSDVRASGSGLANRILVAAGGGGAGFNSPGGAGGADVGATAPQDPTFANPATGGTQSAGGSGAYFDFAPSVHGGNGTLGAGGAGLQQPNGGGGGGGGGYYGGGGGLGASGGAGGSNYVTPNALDAVSERGVAAPVPNGGEGAVIVQYGVADTPTFTADTPPTGMVGLDYSYTFAASGWPPPELHLSGTLPGGLSFDSRSGTLSGNPTEAGTFPLTLQALTPVGSYDDPVTLVIQPATSAPTISGDPPDGTVGSAYAFDYAMTGDPAPTASVTSGDLPPGLGLSGDGHLSGTPTEAGTWSFTVTATSTEGADSVDSTITVAATVPGPPTIGTATPGDGSATVTFTPPSSNGGSDITGYTATATPVVAGPPTVTGTGTGSPLTISGLTNGTTYTITVAATNGAGTGPDSGPSNPVTPVAVIAPLQITTTSPLPPGTVGQPYTATLTATGGVAPYRWSLPSGSHLPAGLTLQPDGTIVGVPKTACTSTFTVRVTDAEAVPQTAQKQFRLTIGPAPHPDLAVRTDPLSTFKHGAPAGYRITVTNTGTAATTTPAVVTVTLGRGLTATTWAGSGWSCSQKGLRCSHSGVLAPGESASYLLGVQVTAAVNAKVSATSCVTPTDPTPGDNKNSSTVTVRK
ncbi:fibronectin type III domain-containing protein [Petropleomorpha daqingensis]|uniref:receptor protein-tyrosine kinase n=1 Tax=Petropleomorpha daqingensis TaxID=2026353 RepID=A0A853C8F8_9ACTN|nr:fibronectin type III domain-containing protein [Petropleomorpha daqingensis]NYJ04280.1 hypothetical protein [Petropleomorpha daqingensis]